MGNNLSLVEVSNPVNGTVVLNEFGNVEFTPDADFDGIASFDCTVTDGTENATASVSVVVNPVNDAPILINPIPNITVDKNAPNSVIELTNYFDDSLSWLIDRKNRQVYIYSPNVDVQCLDNPVTASDNSILPGFTLDFAKIW